MKTLDDRVDQDILIDIETYGIGLLYLLDYLLLDLRYLLEEEGRYRGICKSYMDSIENAILNVDWVDDDKEIYEKILFLFRPLFQKEWKRLQKKRHLSPGDSLKIKIKKVLSIIKDVNPDNEYIRSINTIKKIIDKLFENIRNKKKDDNLFNLGTQLRTFIGEGKIGKFPLKRFSVIPKEIEKTKLDENSKEVLVISNELWTKEISKPSSSEIMNSSAEK